jgi:hypothetical protein
MGMGMGVNPYPLVYMGDPMGLFLCRGYGYGVVIPGGYLPIAISKLVVVASVLVVLSRISLVHLELPVPLKSTETYPPS